uniref:Alpha-2-macroglobulin n=1 Tax=Oryctolagus cuniculus TaxID=9986 RepID=A0A5F9D2M1_RABIT
MQIPLLRRQYIVLVPSELYAGVPEKACVILNHLNETMTLNMTLEYGTQKRNLLTDVVTQRNSFYCSPFIYIPKLPLSFALVTVEVKGPTQHFIKRKPMTITQAENIVFVQTDKPIYKPGQTVRFRIVSVDVNFHPVNETVSLITNPKKNRIFQWESLKLQGGLTQLSFPLSVEPILGHYKIIVTPQSGKRIEHSFEVKEYVLPKFEVQVKMPKIIGFLDEEFVVTACGSYTYGKPVPGLVTINICRKYLQYGSMCHNKYPQSICEEFSQQVCGNQFPRDSNTRSWLELTGYGSSEITNNLSKLKFTKVKSHYRHGIPFLGVDAHAHQLSFTTNERGLADISIDTTSFTTSTISVTYKWNSYCFDSWWLEELHTPAQHVAAPVFSPSNSYVQLDLVGTVACGQTQEIRAHYILNGQILKDEKEGVISKSGIHVLSITQGNMTGVFSFSFRVEPDIAPTAHLVVYAVLPDGEIVADTEKLEIEDCFANKVGCFSLPASDAHLKVTASPLSLCALRAVDQSVLLMKPETELSPRSIYTLLPVKSVFGVGSGGSEGEDGERCVSAEDIIHNGLIYMPKQILNADDVDSIFKVVLPSKILWFGLKMRRVHSSLFPFPSLSGGSELAVKVPDTITEWKANALCLSGSTGLGLSPIVSLNVFQPFFLELTLPYSVVRGEAFTLKATVFNYLSYCIRVKVHLGVSSAFLAVPTEKNEESHCVCGNKQKTLSWAVTPKSLGKVNFTATAEALHPQELCDNEVAEVPALGQKDTVVKTLIVEPEGIEKEETFNTLLCASGDILGSAMQNLENLLQIPYGCGEQNMVLFVPNIYVLNYLNETRQLTEKIKSKAISHLISGYQRQLNYKHSDGSYSTFGDQNGRSQGNTWLTAFVLKSFAQAQSHIFVEKLHIMNALAWLSRKQKENGCFQRSGSLLNNAIKGGVDDEVTLSAYITIALLEIPLPVTHTIVRNALFCLEMAWGPISEGQGNPVYTKALLAYAFALAGNQALRSELLRSLDRVAVKDEDSIHWQRPEIQLQEDKMLYYQPRAPSAEVEMTSYVLLAYLTVQPTPSSKDLSVASRIVKWIIKQQNPHGGFSSTQDTVVALQALSKYGAVTFTKNEKAAAVTIKSSKTFSEKFQVHDANRLLLQEVVLPEIPGNYSTTVSGAGCVYLQTSLRYNILPKKEGNVPFTLHVATVPKNCDGADAHRTFQIHVNISYTGKRPTSNMVIVDVKMVSGFIPVKTSVKKLQEQPHIQRTEVSTNHVLIYFEELTNKTLSFSFLVEQDIQIENLKPATVKAYDYYETDEFTIEEYSAPCSAGKV